MQRSNLLIVAFAALDGAAGVALSAAAAHISSAANLDTASRFLMIHAAAALGLGALLAAKPPLGRWLTGVGFALLAGVALFSGDLVARAFAGDRLFPYAAPIGGSLTIASWLALAIWALAALRAK
ncbi:DUF423 domain-containing protein [Methylosinus sporium]|uniref:DUF423 domain-containing protein n=1 Tax=Methylosinus sporium TaxID=428 RepID=A0A549T3P9_METSR|nr:MULTISPECIES: DUF423 domain-containing protein [Methylosinus]MBU3886860.1 DUF423 domain-containing protein [Methylosinus sp. KRF6]TRL36539.1 DUF423 domain-containing protein [Methylosinus sporium]